MRNSRLREIEQDINEALRVARRRIATAEAAERLVREHWGESDLSEWIKRQTAEIRHLLDVRRRLRILRRRVEAEAEAA